MVRRSVSIPIFICTWLAAASAFAFAPQGWVAEHHGLELKSQEKVRDARSLEYAPPADRQAALQRFVRETGGAWRAAFDPATGAPVRVYGSGVAARDASLSPEAALVATRALIGAHLDLFAPGVELSDLELVSNEYDPASGLRSIGFLQRHRGMLVEGGRVNARIKNDRIFLIGSEATVGLDLSPAPAPATDKAVLAARAWIEKDLSATFLERARVEAPSVLPVVLANGDVHAYVVVEVEIRTQAPASRWSVYLDARTLAPIARRQTLLFADGTLRFNAPERWPGSTRPDWVAPFVNVTPSGGAVSSTDVNGLLTWSGSAPLPFTVQPRGPGVNVLNDGGALASISGTLDPGGSFTWDARGEELVDAQINGFIASSTVRAYTAKIAPNVPFLTQETLQTTVNIADSCNAFSDGQSVNFFVSNRQCENTARISDVVYHEFGHSFHAHVIVRGVGNFDTSLSEGASDFLAASMTGDHGMGRGFFRTNQALRDLDLPQDAVWPDDVAGDPHETGVIFGGAMWDLRKALIAKFGEQAGRDRTEFLWWQTLRNAADIPSSFADVLAADDDDGNLSNGTPNQCDITEAFARHGLADPSLSGPQLSPPLLNGDTVSVPFSAPANACPSAAISAITLFWRLRHDTNIAGTVQLVPGSNAYTAQIPPAPAGSVVEYRLEVALGSGQSLELPDNPADRWYQQFVGDVVPIYCTNFEADPTADGFSHRLIAGMAAEGADDWTWGAPAGVSGSGDPSAAYSGSKVFGNDLGGGNFNGKYQSNKTNALTLPIIDVSGYGNVRLQYRRWLTVEDGDFDQATIRSNGTDVWHNLASGNQGGTNHEDKEWRFQDVDLSNTVQDGKVEVSFELKSDPGLELGGWTIDDLCIVAFDDGAARCGNGAVEANEVCDDGNQTPGDGCEADCTSTPRTPACGDGVLDPGEACDDGNLADGDTCQANCSLPPTTEPTSNCPNGEAECMLDPNGNLTTLDGEGGCGCSSSAHPEGTPALALAALAFGLITRRRRA